MKVRGDPDIAFVNPNLQSYNLACFILTFLGEKENRKFYYVVPSGSTEARSDDSFTTAVRKKTRYACNGWKEVNENEHIYFLQEKAAAKRIVSISHALHRDVFSPSFNLAA